MRAAKWLMNKEHCRFVLRETNALTGECPDAIGWKYGHRSLMVEAKVSRADFLADRKKQFRKTPSKGVGLFRWMMVPAGMLTVEDMKSLAGWGLLEVKGRSVRETIRATPQPEVDRRAEVSILVQAVANSQLCAGQDLNDWFQSPESAVGALRAQRREIGDRQRERERNRKCDGVWGGPGNGWISCDAIVATGHHRCSEHGGKTRRQPKVANG